MENEWPYQLAVLAILLATGGIAGYRRLQARSGERISRRDEGLYFATILRLGGLGLWIAVLLYIVAPHWIAWASLPLPPAVRWTGGVVGVAAMMLLYWTLSTLGKNLTDTVVTRSNATLVTNGPYRYVRHPFYVTAGMVIMCSALLAANWLIAVWGLIILVMLAIRTPNEEAHLVARFGDEYRRYMAATPRFFPRLTARPK